MSNVRSLSDAKKKRENSKEKIEMSDEIMESYFEDVMKHNERVKEKRKSEIAKANKSVLRSYRVKS